MACGDRVHGGRCAGERHMAHIHLADEFENALGGQMGRGARASGPIGELFPAREFDGLAERIGLQRGGPDDDIGRGRHERCGPQIIRRIAGIGVVGEIDREGAGGDENRVAVGLRARDRDRADIAPCATAILDDDGLAPFFLQRRADDACAHIGGAARSEGDHQFHIAVGKILRESGRRAGERETGEGEAYGGCGHQTIPGENMVAAFSSVYSAILRRVVIQTSSRSSAIFIMASKAHAPAGRP